jgi:arylsulfatase A
MNEKTVVSISRLAMWTIILLVAEILAPLPASAHQTASRKPLPNIVLVLIDDYGWADTGSYGSSYHRTPNIDRLAARGVRFTDAYAAAPVCSPTRAALMTGKHPARLHLTDWLPGRRDMPSQMLRRPIIKQELPLTEMTLAEGLKQAGYVTAHVGKWHLGGPGFEPERQGFHLNIAGDHTGTPLSYFAPFRNKEGRFMPGLERAPEGEYLPDRLTAEAEGFIERSVKEGQPFFLYLPHYTVHIPLKAKADLIAKYRALPKPDKGQNNPVYAAMIESMDESVGRLMTKLEQLGVADDTIFVFTSDNGGLATQEGPDTPATINAPLRAGKGYLYEGGLRVPLIVSWPKRVTAGVNRTPFYSADLFATLLDAAGVKNASGVDGVSLLPLLTGRRVPQRAELFWHYPHYSNQGGKPGGVVRQGRYKLIEFYEDSRVELYDLSRDLGETNDLAAKLPDKAAELRRRLAAWRRAVGAQMMTPNPEYKTSSRNAPRPETKGER